MSPICLAGPLKSVINGVLGGGGSIYWRSVLLVHRASCESVCAQENHKACNGGSPSVALFANRAVIIICNRESQNRNQVLVLRCLLLFPQHPATQKKKAAAANPQRSSHSREHIME